MYVKEFSHRVAFKVGCSPEVARAVMEAMAEILRGLDLGEVARTPLGAFKMHHVVSRMTHLPGKSGQKVFVRGYMFAKRNEGVNIITAYEDEPEQHARRRKGLRPFPGLDPDYDD